eukprot:5860294-Pleurochrysis_carterae.AAC.1
MLRRVAAKPKFKFNRECPKSEWEEILPLAVSRPYDEASAARAQGQRSGSLHLSVGTGSKRVSSKAA